MNDAGYIDGPQNGAYAIRSRNTDPYGDRYFYQDRAAAEAAIQRRLDRGDEILGVTKFVAGELEEVNVPFTTSISILG